MLDQRIEGVLAVVYGVFTEGYAATIGAGTDGCRAVRRGHSPGTLARCASAEQCGGDGTARAHAAARCAPSGASLERRQCGPARRSRPLAVESGSDRRRPRARRSIAVDARGASATTPSRRRSPRCTCARPRADATDWPQIVGLYEVLLRLHPTPVVELNHAVAVSMVDGPARALDLVDSLAARGEVADYHLLHATRGNLLARLGRREEAREAYRGSAGGRQARSRAKAAAGAHRGTWRR